ncbi:MAG: stage V sporulation protein SpoVM [Clostridia bacterium]|nr:stage V sporulation protein SpoVM [Clostridia bacterium]MBQ9957430.1 stage V sporulation protein SpoVM [Clostridia bacterium]
MLCVWVTCGILSATDLHYNFSRFIADFTRFYLLQILIKGLRFMKVVLVKSPKMLSGLLRLLFGIKKENNT